MSRFEEHFTPSDKHHEQVCQYWGKISISPVFEPIHKHIFYEDGCSWEFDLGAGSIDVVSEFGEYLSVLYRFEDIFVAFGFSLELIVLFI